MRRAGSNASLSMAHRTRMDPFRPFGTYGVGRASLDVGVDVARRRDVGDERARAGRVARGGDVRTRGHRRRDAGVPAGDRRRRRRTRSETRVRVRGGAASSRRRRTRARGVGVDSRRVRPRDGGGGAGEGGSGRRRAVLGDGPRAVPRLILFFSDPAHVFRVRRRARRRGDGISRATRVAAASTFASLARRRVFISASSRRGGGRVPGAFGRRRRGCSSRARGGAPRARVHGGVGWRIAERTTRGRRWGMVRRARLRAASRGVSRRERRRRARRSRGTVAGTRVGTDGARAAVDASVAAPCARR